MTKAQVPASYKELESYLPYLVNRLASLGQYEQNRVLTENGINLVCLRTLSILHIENGLTINEIASRTFTEQSSASRAIEAMVTQGLVERRIPAHDQRRREVILTDCGLEQLQRCWPAMNDFIEMLYRGTSQSDREICRKILAQMLDNLATYTSES